MTPKQILDSFSETLMQDDRILSAPERALLTSLLQHSRTAASDNPETREAVRSVIASAVGETVAQRAFAVLGESIVERILENGKGHVEDSAWTTDPQAEPKNPLRHTLGNPSQPQTPGVTPPPGGKAPSKPLDTPTPGQPQTPGVTPPPGGKAPQPPATPLRRDAPVPPPKQPQTPGASLRPLEEPTRVRVVQQAGQQSGAVVAERPANLPAQCVILDEFLAPQELEELLRFTFDHETAFQASEVISPKAEQGVINYEHRRSLVLMELERFQNLILDRIKTALPRILDQLGMEEFPITGVEAQITASNDGDFFRFHNDNGSDPVASRHLTFVYFFHHEPRQFEGGELRIHDSRLEGGEYLSDGSYQAIVPQQNQIVFFPCELMHEITPVEVPSRLFADSRFTLNGWLRR